MARLTSLCRLFVPRAFRLSKCLSHGLLQCDCFGLLRAFRLQCLFSSVEIIFKSDVATNSGVSHERFCSILDCALALLFPRACLLCLSQMERRKSLSQKVGTQRARDHCKGLTHKQIWGECNSIQEQLGTEDVALINECVEVSAHKHTHTQTCLNFVIVFVWFWRERSDALRRILYVHSN